MAGDGSSGVFVGVPGQLLAVQLCFLMAAAGILVGKIYAVFERINDPGMRCQVGSPAWSGPPSGSAWAWRSRWSSTSGRAPTPQH